MFFQINFQVIKIMRSKNLSFEFIKDIDKFMIFIRDYKNVESIYQKSSI